MAGNLKIALIGFMGVGKTTLGKKLATILNAKLIDVDQYIEEMQSCKISEIFENNGEEFFRSLETFAIKEILNDNGNVIIATGGGLPCYSNNMETLNKLSITVHLKLPIEMIVSRLEGDLSRPLFKGKNKEELTENLTRLYESRKETYEQAHVAFETMNVSSKRVNELAELLLSHH